MSFITIDKELVYKVCIEGLVYIDSERIRLCEIELEKEMNKKTWFGFGRTRTRDEVLEDIKNSQRFHEYDWCKIKYSEIEKKFKTLIKAISISKNDVTGTMQLSIEDAKLIQNWS
jgi:hypothetical protein